MKLPSYSTRSLLAGSVAALIGLAGNLHAQESVRPSLAGASASAARRATLAPPFIYNLKLGPVIFDLTTSFGLEFNDNINLAPSGRQSDLILRPAVNLNSFWQITELNALRLDLGFSYAKYVDHSNNDAKALLISPNSQLSFDVFIADFRINLHDRFSLLQDPISNINLSNVSQFTRFQNTGGLSVLWDLHDLKLVAGYDHYNFISLDDEFEYLNRSEEQFTFSAALRLSDANTIGLDAGSSLIDYEQNVSNDAVSFQVGPFWEATLTNFIKLRLSAGYQLFDFETGGTSGFTGDSSAPFASLTLAHRLNPFITENLVISYESILGVNSNFTQLTSVRYGANWRMNPVITLNFDAFFEDGDDSPGINSEHAQRYGTGIGFSYLLTQKLTVDVHYGFILKESSLATNDYRQNRVTLNFGYNF